MSSNGSARSAERPPLTNGASDAQTKPAAALAEVRRPLLIIEDDPALQKQMKWAFDGYETVVASDRDSAIAQVRRYEPAVVTMDLGLPPNPDDPREGLALLEEIHSLAPDTKVIVLTGQSDRANALKAIGLGAYDFCTKPFEPGILTWTIERAFRVHELQDSLEETIGSLERTAGDNLSKENALEKVRRELAAMRQTEAQHNRRIEELSNRISELEREKTAVEESMSNARTQVTKTARELERRTADLSNATRMIERLEAALTKTRGAGSDQSQFRLTESGRVSSGSCSSHHTRACRCSHLSATDRLLNRSKRMSALAGRREGAFDRHSRTSASTRGTGSATWPPGPNKLRESPAPDTIDG